MTEVLNFIPCRLNGGCEECLKGVAEARCKSLAAVCTHTIKFKDCVLEGGMKNSLCSKGWSELDKFVPFYQYSSCEEHFCCGCNYNIGIVCSYRLSLCRTGQSKLIEVVFIN